MNLDTAHDDAFDPHMDWALWRKVMRFARPYAGYFWALAAVAVLTAGCDIAVLFLPGLIIDHVTRGGGAGGLWGYAGLYTAVSLFFGACIVAFIVLAGKIATGTQYDIREASFRKL